MRKIVALLMLLPLMAMPQTFSNGRERIKMNEGWKFAFGNASDPQEDFGCGTEYFNHLTKANSIHDQGPYSPKFGDADWQPVRIPPQFCHGTALR